MAAKTSAKMEKEMKIVDTTSNIQTNSVLIFLFLNTKTKIKERESFMQ